MYIGKGDDKMVYHQPSVNSRRSFPEKKCEIGEGKSKNIDIHFHYNTHRKVKLGIRYLRLLVELCPLNAIGIGIIKDFLSEF